MAFIQRETSGSLSLAFRNLKVYGGGVPVAYKYFLRFLKEGTLDWVCPFPADASSTSRANEGPGLVSSAIAHGLPAMGPGRADSA